MNYLREAWRKSFTYEGRASRKEYWMTVLWYVISVVVSAGLIILLRFPLGLPDFIEEIVFGWLFYLFLLALVVYVTGSFLVFLALAVRRIHDIGLSGWLVLIGLVPFFGTLVIFIFTLIPGNLGDNKYGPDQIRPIVVTQ
jgi:uncharacterized membrane protein YhaH (DUF805 family)